MRHVKALFAGLSVFAGIAVLALGMRFYPAITGGLVVLFFAYWIGVLMTTEIVD